jgi:hypothetical protein
MTNPKDLNQETPSLSLRSFRDALGIGPGISAISSSSSALQTYDADAKASDKHLSMADVILQGDICLA